LHCRLASLGKLSLLPIPTSCFDTRIYTSVTLGGGYGWQTSSHGLAADNLVSLTLTTSTGSHLSISADSHPDLFWAVRGGGGNFGVVSELVVKLHKQRPTVYAGIMVFPGVGEKMERLIEVTKGWWETAGERMGMMQISLVMPDGNVRLLFLIDGGGGAEHQCLACDSCVSVL
jgi:FAD/FMN-containing dehydrogenase